MLRRAHPGHHDAAHHRWLRRVLDRATSADAAAEAADRLGRPERARAWADLLASAAQLAPVLVHGEIHEDQLLAEDGQLTGLIDGETARVDHPFWDFDPGQWGTGLWWRRRRDLSVLLAQEWRAYARARGLDIGPCPLETAFASGTRLVFSPIPVIQLSSARSKSTSRSYNIRIGTAGLACLPLQRLPWPRRRQSRVAEPVRLARQGRSRSLAGSAAHAEHPVRRSFPPIDDQLTKRA